MWQALTILFLATLALVTLQVWWQRKFERSQQAARVDARELEQRLRQQTVEVQTQQQALFNSMVEGFLLLDEKKPGATGQSCLP